MSREAIDKTNALFVSAMNDGDIPKAMSVYTNDAKLLPPNSPALQGVSNIQKFWEGATEALGIEKVSINTVNVDFIDDTAIEHGEYTLGLANGTDKGKFIMVWQRQDDDTWKWHIDIFNSDLPPAS